MKKTRKKASQLAAPKPPSRGYQSQERQRIAEYAARLLEEGSCADIDSARKKACAHWSRHGNRPSSSNKARHRASIQPSRQDIEQALLARAQVFHPDKHQRQLRDLREQALHAMEFLNPFQPRLVGTLVHGAIRDASHIELELDVESSEQLLLFLHERQIPFRCDERHIPQSNGRSLSQESVHFLAGEHQINLYLLSQSQANRPALADKDSLDQAALKALLSEDQRSPKST